MLKDRNSDHLLVLKEMQNILPAIPSVTKMVLDFEIAMWATIPTVFHKVSFMGCAFHWKQAVWRKIQELGLVIAYRYFIDCLCLLIKVRLYTAYLYCRQDDSHRKYIKRLMSLPYLPAEHIVETFR